MRHGGVGKIMPLTDSCDTRIDAIKHAVTRAIERHFDWREAMRKGKK